MCVAFVYMHAFMCDYTRVWRLKVNAKCLPQFLSSLFTEAGPLPEAGTHQLWIIYQSSLLQGAPLSVN